MSVFDYWWLEYCEKDDCDWFQYVAEVTWLEQCAECGRYSRVEQRMENGWVLILEECP